MLVSPIRWLRVSTSRHVSVFHSRKGLLQYVSSTGHTFVVSDSKLLQWNAHLPAMADFRWDVPVHLQRGTVVFYR